MSAVYPTGTVFLDANILAAMKRENIVSMATSDPDFDDIDWIKVFKPRKVQPRQAGKDNKGLKGLTKS